MSSIDGSDHSGSSGDENDDANETESLSNGDGSEGDNASDDDADTTGDIKAGDTTDVTAKELSKKKSKKKDNTVILPFRKIGPQKQKKEIHTILKKAKTFEIRKLTRRITMLRNLKGSDEQKAKNNRKVEKLLLEIQAMKEFMIDQITERLVDIFKGISDKIYLDIWNAAQEHKEFEKMLQILSNGNDENKYKDIAFLRMISSKDIICQLKMVNSGTNIKKPKSKKALKKQLRKYNQMNKKSRKVVGGGAAIPVKRKDTPSMEITEEKSTDTKISESTKSKEESDKRKPKSKVKKVKKNVDSFFLPPDTTASNNDDSSDEEFSAPAEETAKTKKKNRMGQNARRRLVERQHAKDMTRNSNRTFGSVSKHSSTHRGQSKISKISETNKTDDTKLHPSWEAKQKQKAQQSITAFSGTKITFDD